MEFSGDRRLAGAERENASLMPWPLFTNVITAFTTVGKTTCLREWHLELNRVVGPPSELSGFHPLETELRTFAGARIVRIFDAPNSRIDEHAHDWPILSLHVVGTCRKLTEFGETFIGGPSAVLHGIDAPHANVVGATGLEQLEIQFDPAWVGMSRRELRSMRWWTGGSMASASMSLSRMWRDMSANERTIANATRCFLQSALARSDSARPSWLNRLEPYLDSEHRKSTREIARDLGVHPVWLTRAYRAVVGEGMHETMRRKRVERALVLLRDARWSAAQIAVEAGFCDQSHMIRSFRTVLGRSPREAQREQHALAHAMPLIGTAAQMHGSDEPLRTEWDRYAHNDTNPTDRCATPVQRFG